MIATERMDPWLGLLLVTGMLAAVLLVLTVLQRRKKLRPESARKGFHVGGCLIALSLPWIFDEMWPVVATWLVASSALLALRVVPALRAGPGQVLHRVNRKSYGEFWLLLGVLVIFLIAGDRVVIYSIGVIVLAVADSAAALVGVAYGLHQFAVRGGKKSAEGSIALFMTAFLGVQIPLLLFTEIGRAELLLIATNIGLLVTFGEANLSRGADNAVLPIAVVVLLDMYWDKTAATLLPHLAVIVLLGLAVILFRNRSTLSTDALMGAVIVNYVYWAFGDWRFLVPPLALYLLHIRLIGWPKLLERKSFHADVLLAIAAPGLIYATIYAETSDDNLYLLFAASFASVLAGLGTLHWKLRAPDDPPLRIAAVTAAKALIVLIPGLSVAGYYPISVMVSAVLSIPFSLVVFAFTSGPLVRNPMSGEAWLAMPVSVMIGTSLSFFALHPAAGALLLTSL